MTDAGKQTSHVVEVVLGGNDTPRPRKKPRRSPALKVIEAPLFEPRPGLPAGGRAECRHGERPCPYVRCEWHLWLELSENRRGRPWKGKRPPTTLQPRWLEYPTPACCGADIAEALHGRDAQGLYPAIAIGQAMSRDRTHVHRELRGALAKLRAMGKSVEEWLETLGARTP